jgi:hypothetical protein
MKEVIFDYEEFKGKIDRTQPIHHCCVRKCIDPKNGIFYRLTFRIFGVSKNGNHIIIYHLERRTTIADPEENNHKWYVDLVTKFAKPLGSTEGMILP